MKCLLFAVLAWCGAVCAPAEEYAFPGEREWISKFGDVVKGSFHSCTGAGAVLKIGRRHVEIPLTRLDEEDAALAASLTGAEARRNLKLAAMLWPFLMKELQKVTWTPAEKNISPRYHEMARKKNAGALTGTRKSGWTGLCHIAFHHSGASVPYPGILPSAGASGKRQGAEEFRCGSGAGEPLRLL